MGLVAVTAGLFTAGAYLDRDLSYQWGWLGFIAALACIIGMNVAPSDPMLAASIFLDILIVFLVLLSLFGGNRD